MKTLTHGVRYSDVDDEPVAWFMRGAGPDTGTIPYGDAVFLVGDPGLGKDLLGLDWAARATVGAEMPDGTPAEPPGSVIIISPEDRRATTRARLEAAGADMTKVIDLTEVKRGYTSRADGDDQFAWPDDLPILVQTIKEAGDCRLVWISPLSEVSTYALTNARTVRRFVMRPLRNVAKQTGVAIVVLGHLTKEGVIASSGAIVQTVRSVLWVRADPVRPGERVVLLHKTNIADKERAVPLRYTFQGSGDTTRVKYLVSDPETGSDWSPAEPGEPKPGTGRAVVLMHLRGECECEDTACGGQMTSRELWAVSGIDHDTIRVQLKRLVDPGLVRRDDRGVFSAVTVTTASEQPILRSVTVTRGAAVPFVTPF